MASFTHDWTLAITKSDHVETKKLLELDPKLLWTPILHSQDDNLQTRLVQLGYLGTQFHPLCAIHLSLLLFEKYHDLEFISLLLKKSVLQDLNTKFWGQCNNTALHLACFLNQQPIVDLLLEKGVSQRANSLGYFPGDINLSIKLTATDKRFIIGSLNQKKTEHQYFKKGHVKETQKKVLTEEEQIVEEQRRRQKEVAQLAKRSAVKTNPLYQRFEKITLKAGIYSEDESSSEEETQFYEIAEESTDEEGIQQHATVLKPIYKTTLLSGETMIDPAARSPETIVKNEDQLCREMKRRSGSQKAAWTMSISSWAAILDREFNLNDLNPVLLENDAPKLDTSLLKRDDDSISDLPTRLDQENPPPQVEPIPNLESSRQIRQLIKPSLKGKLYLHIHSIQDILLPMPKDRSFIRCVVSDGRFEYMSRYEVLTHNTTFDYECVIDTRPDMIITVSLHVRPDYIMKSRKPFSRLFTSRKKKKESLSSYVNKEDGAIGQARFALDHMQPACNETKYEADLSCFNSWYSKSFKEKHRQKKKDQDILKVVGNFNISMLYLPHSSNQNFPRNLSEYSRCLS